MKLTILRPDKIIDVAPTTSYYEEAEMASLDNLPLDQAATRKVLKIHRVAVDKDNVIYEEMYAIDDEMFSEAMSNLVRQKEHWYEMWNGLKNRINKACFWRRLKYLFTGRL